MIPRRSWFTLANLAPYIAFILVLAAGAFTSSHFFSVQNLLNISRQVSYTGIIALGMTFVIISGGIDLSVGSAVAFVGGVIVLSQNYFFVKTDSETGAFFLALICGLLLSVVGSVLAGFFITKFNMAPFIVTLGFMGIYRSMALYFGNGGEFRVDGPIKLFSAFGSGKVWQIPIPSLIFVLLALLFWVILNWTRFGRYVCAVGSNEKVAAYAAVRVGRVRTITYAICGATVAVSAFLLSARMNSINSTNAGTLYELDSIAAVVIGGTAMTGGSGSMIGTVIGAFILGMINNELNMWGVSAYLQGTVKGIIIVLSVLVQSVEFQTSLKDAVMAIVRLLSSVRKKAEK